MRKIEEEMLAAIECGKNWGKDNTRTIPAIMPDRSYSVVIELHGNHIATCNSTHGIITNVRVNVDTLKQWPSVTTKSRLRALGVNLTQKKGKIYIDDRYICEVK